MKKKLLSLVLAGAMVASTSVSAFANTSDTAPNANTGDTVSNKVYEAKEGTAYEFTDEQNTDITIEGNIANNNNKVNPSTISVTVPTAAKFTVDSKGKLIGSNIYITSQSQTPVEVIAYDFKDPNGVANINAVSLNDLESENSGTSGNGDRSKVYLTLTGKDVAVSLQSQNGVCELNGDAKTGDKVLGRVENGQSLKLRLEGQGVTSGAPLTNAVSDNFTLVLKLKKVSS